MLDYQDVDLQKIYLLQDTMIETQILFGKSVNQILLLFDSTIHYKMYLRYIIVNGIPSSDEDIIYRIKQLCNVISAGSKVYDSKKYLESRKYSSTNSLILKDRDPKKIFHMLESIYKIDRWNSYLVDEGRILVLDI